MIVLETGSAQWSRPDTKGIVPSARGDTQVVYDTKGGRIVLYGGWANRWYGDLFQCKVLVPL